MKHEFDTIRRVELAYINCHYMIVASIVAVSVINTRPFGLQHYTNGHETISTVVMAEINSTFALYIAAQLRVIYIRFAAHKQRPYQRGRGIPERLKFRLDVLVFKCRNKTAPQYLADDLQWAADDSVRTRLRSASFNKLVMRRSRQSTAGDRAFGVAAPRLWNGLPACPQREHFLPSRNI